MNSQDVGEIKVNSYASGERVRLLIDDLDNDECGSERRIPAGTIGTITNVEHSAATGYHYHVEFDNGGWLIFYTDQLTAHLELL